MKSYKASFYIACIGCINACAPPPKVVVEERSVLTMRQEAERIGGQLIRIVQPGDTLYSIAFATNLNPNRVAAWNDIRDTSNLRVGQRIRLTEPIGFVEKPVVKAPKAVNRTKKVESRPSKAVAAKPKSEVRPSTSTVRKTAATIKPKKAVKAPQDAWRWPLHGKVIRGFSPSKSQQGVDIKAKLSQSVKAARAGEVVYVGNSLRGYGNLIIVKHDERYLSAYAHNRRILVKEGQNVARHQALGTVGYNAKKESALHFQIRYQGRPVNPLKYLPAK